MRTSVSSGMGTAALVGLLAGTAVFWGVPAHAKGPAPKAAAKPAADELPDGDADLPDGDDDVPAPKPAPKPAKPAKPAEKPVEKAPPPKAKPTPPPEDDDIAPPPEERPEPKAAPKPAEKASRVLEEAMEETPPPPPSKPAARPAAAAENPRPSRALVDDEPADDEFLSSKPVKPSRGSSGGTRELTATGETEPAAATQRGAIARADEGSPLYANPILYVVAGGIGVGGVVAVVVILALVGLVVGSILVIALNPGGILNAFPNPFAAKTGTVKVKVN